jgi:two-component sensor histidine kinase
MNSFFKKAVGFWSRWTKPRSSDSEERMQEYITRVVILVSHLTAPLFGVIALLASFCGTIPYDTPFILFFMAFILGLAMKLCDLGYWRVARFVPPLLVAASAVYGNWLGGIDAPANLLYALTVILASILFGGRHWVFILFAVIMVYSGISYMHHVDVIEATRSGEHFFYNRLIINIAAISIIAVLIYFMISRLTFALNAANSNASRLEVLLSDNRLLLKEMHHRVKNNLQITCQYY